MSNVIHQTIFNTLEQWAPKKLAYDWDHVGLQVGSYDTQTKGVLVSLDVNEAVVDEAIEHNVNLIVAHHPLLFTPLKKIDVSTVKGNIIAKLLQHHITVYASHTNLDIAEGGVNDLLSEQLGLTNVKPLAITKTGSLVKLIVFTPTTHVEQVVNALSDAGAGHIGNYSHCTFQSPGTGTFMPLEGTNPFIGETNELEKVDEIKIETIVPEEIITEVTEAMKLAHPYEEVAYDLVPLKNEGKTYGLGRIGTINGSFTLNQLIHHVKDKYGIEQLRFVGELKKQINNVAIIGGSGQTYYEHAIKAGADVLITGDVTFHHAQEANEMGLSIIDAGHYIEKIMKGATKRYIEHHFPKMRVLESQINTNPFQFL